MNLKAITERLKKLSSMQLLLAFISVLAFASLFQALSSIWELLYPLSFVVDLLALFVCFIIFLEIWKKNISS